MAEDNKFSLEIIRGQLDRILRSPHFKGSSKQRAFLSFVVGETLAGRTSQIKGYTIAVAVYGRNEGFDPQTDPVVRLEAGRLRRALANYYQSAGQDDPLRIEIAKGGYVPSFEANAPRSAAATSPTAEHRVNGQNAGPSIAVMPLSNLTGDAGQDYFVDGLTEELTSELARYQEFRVIASQSTLRYKGEKVDPKEICRELGVRFLLMGSVRKGSENIKVAVQLLDTTTAEQIWGESYKRNLDATDLIELQEEIGHRVIGTIADHYGPITRKLSREAGRKAPASLEEYDAVLRFYHYETMLTPEAFKTALSALEGAVESDPDYGLAWSMMGHLHADNYALGFCETEAPLEKALTYAQRGMALAPENQFASDALSLVYFHRGDKELFLKHAETTIALNPNAPYVIGVAGWHMALFGEWKQGLALLHKGMELNPFYPSWFHLATFMNEYRLGAWENAFEEAIKFNFPALYLDPMIRAAVLAQMGRSKESQGALKELLALVPDFATQGPDLIGRYVKVADLADAIMAGLKKAGLGDI